MVVLFFSFNGKSDFQRLEKKIWKILIKKCIFNEVLKKKDRKGSTLFCCYVFLLLSVKWNLDNLFGKIIFITVVEIHKYQKHYRISVAASLVSHVTFRSHHHWDQQTLQKKSSETVRGFEASFEGLILKVMDPTLIIFAIILVYQRHEIEFNFYLFYSSSLKQLKKCSLLP